MRARPAAGRGAVAVLAVLITLATSCGSDGHSGASRSVRWDGRDRVYTVQAPRHLTRHAPIFVILHLRQRNVAELPGFADLPAAARKRGFLVVTPMGIDYSWNAGACCDPAQKQHVDDVGFLRHVIADVRHEFGNRRRPVVVAGFSNGAFMAYRLACAGTPLSGIAMVEGVAGVDRCHLADPPPNYLQIHQTGDHIVPLRGTAHPVVPGATAFPSVAETSARWRTAAGCGNASAVTATPGTRTVVYPCAHGRSTTVTVMDGGTHDWPTSPADPVDATTSILDFFTTGRGAPAGPRTR